MSAHNYVTTKSQRKNIGWSLLPQTTTVSYSSSVAGGGAHLWFDVDMTSAAPTGCVVRNRPLFSPETMALLALFHFYCVSFCTSLIRFSSS